MNPYIKKIVELNKIHKSIDKIKITDDGGGSDSDTNYTNNIERLTDGKYKNIEEIPEGTLNEVAADQEIVIENLIVSEGWTRIANGTNQMPSIDAIYIDGDMSNAQNPSKIIFYNAVYVNKQNGPVN